MLGFLKRLFSKEPEVLTEEVELVNLDSWFSEKTLSKLNSLNADLKAVNDKVSASINETRSSIETLNKAGLQNPNIPERAKHFMQGNRDAYSKRVGLFLDRIHTPDAVQDFPVFYSALQDELKELVQGTARSFQVLQEFLADESRKVRADVGAVEQELNSFKKRFDDAGLDVFDDTKKRIIDFQTKVKLRSNLEKDLDDRKKELEDLASRKRQLKEDVELLQKDKELNDLNDGFKRLDFKIKGIRERITNPFSVINTALRKFERITYRHRIIVQEYIDSPLDALLKDLHLSILKALHDLELAVLNNRIDLKDKKKDRTLEVLKLLTKEYLGGFLTEYGQAKQEQDKIKKKLSNLDVVVLLKEKKELIQKLENNIINVERRIDLFSKELDKVDITELEERLVGNLEKITNTVVKLKK